DDHDVTDSDEDIDELVNLSDFFFHAQDGIRDSSVTRVQTCALPIFFAPLKNLGLIIVDEEHETTYKQEEAPRYHARDIAVVRAKIEKCVAVLGRATPSLESYHHAATGKYRLATLTQRLDGGLMPDMG